MNYYDEIASGYNKLYGNEQLKKAKAIISCLKINDADELLDVGCGSGIATELFPCKKTGIDPSKELIKQCSFKAIQGSAENLPFPDAHFDIVISLTALHHSIDFKKALLEMKRVAKKYIVISLLRKAGSFDQMEQEIKNILQVRKNLKVENDMIFFCEEKPETCHSSTP